MKKLLMLLLLVCLVFAVSCGEDEEGPAPSIFGNYKTLNVYNWGEYISDGSEDSFDTVAEFEKWYNANHEEKIKVNYSTYATCEDMYAKITSGAGSYDVIIPSDYMIDKLVAEDWLVPLNKELIPNLEYINEDYRGLYYDPDDTYTVPYSYGVVGVIYNSALVDEEDVEDESWSLLWNEKYRGKILQFNNPRDGFATAQYYLGIDVNGTDRADWQRVLDKMLEQKPLVQGYVSDEIFNKMTTASAAIGTYYAGDYITMVESNEDLAFYYPKEGTNIFVDAMCIPKCAKNVDLACEFINFMLSEEVAIANAEYIGYASPNRLVYENEEYLDYMGEEAIDILYNTEDINANYVDKDGNPMDPYYHRFEDADQEYINGLWEQLKTESSTELWVHITAAVIVLAVVAFAGYTVYIRKLRSRHYRGKKAQ